MDLDFSEAPSSKAGPFDPNPTPVSYWGNPLGPSNLFPALPVLPLLFLYGSQTGNAEVICRDLCSLTVQKGWSARVGSLNEFRALRFSTAPVVVVVCSSSGNGEPPDNASRFVRMIRRRCHAPDFLAGMQFAVLGLGDQNYDKFCGCSRLIDSRLAELGAVRFLARGDADHAVGLELVVEPWKAAFFAQGLPSLRPLPRSGGMGGSQGSTRSLSPFSEDRDSSPEPDWVSCSKGCSQSQEQPGSSLSNTSSVGLRISSFEPASLQSPQLGEHSDASLVSLDQTTVGGLSDFSGCASEDSSASESNSSPTFSVASAQKGELEDSLMTHRRTIVGAKRSMFRPSALVKSSGTSPLETQNSNGFRVSPTTTAMTAFASFSISDPSLYPSPAVPFPLANPCKLSFSTSELVRSPFLASNLSLTRKAKPTRAKGSANSQTITLQATQVGPEPTLPQGFSSREGVLRRYSQASPFAAQVVGCSCLTSPDAVKQVLQLCLSVGHDPEPWWWNPGDSLGVLPRNDEAIVDALLRRLRVRAEEPFLAPGLVVGSSGPVAADPLAPVYRHLQFPSLPKALTVREVLLKYVDLSLKDSRVLPVLARFLQPAFQGNTTSSSIEGQRALLGLWMSSSTAYVSQVLHRKLTILDLLQDWLPATCPPLRALVEALYPLQPRFYSLSSSALVSSKTLNLVFSVVKYELPNLVGGQEFFIVDTRKGPIRGVCTSYLERLGKPYLLTPEGSRPEILEEVEIFLRPSPSLRPPLDPSAAVVMVGPGTGVAPFVALLQHRRELLLRQSQQGYLSPCGEAKDPFPSLCEDGPLSCSSPTATPSSKRPRLSSLAQASIAASTKALTPPFLPAALGCEEGQKAGSSGQASLGLPGPGQVLTAESGESHLFFGCRSRDSDFLFQDNLREFQASGALTELHLALSKESEPGRWYGGGCYVQDKLVECSEKICHLLLWHKAFFLVCGDALMAKGVRQGLQQALQEGEKLTPSEAKEVVAHLRRRGRYQEDIY